MNLYAATKQAFEDILQYYIEANALSVITLKLFDTYGPNDPRPKLFHILKKIANDNLSLAMSPGEQLIDLVHVYDVVNAFVIAGEHLESPAVNGHEIYAVSSGVQIKLKDLVKIYANIHGKELAINWGGREYRNREVMRPWSNGKLLPGWKISIELEEGIMLMKKEEITPV